MCDSAASMINGSRSCPDCPRATGCSSTRCKATLLPPMPALLELRQIAKRVTLPGGDQLHILTAVDLDIHAGEVLAVVGKSGSGKSTLLNVLGLLDDATGGTYVCDG